MLRGLIRQVHTSARRLSSQKGFGSATSAHQGDVVPRIGLEIHAQLDLSSKLFSHGANLYQARSNSQLDLFDIALPGTLPILNLKALELAIVASLGLNCSIQESIHFDRKNYFYADMPAGYQLTQFNNPIAKSGHIDFEVSNYYSSVMSSHYKHEPVRLLHLEEKLSRIEFEPYKKRSRIKQIQLEQDSAKTLTHTDEDEQHVICDLVDYNRSGASLIEIVFEPDLTSPHEASSLVKELISVLKTLGTCKCELQEGTLRVDANVSIKRIRGNEIGPTSKVELKNLNSLRALNRGISQEIERQVSILEAGETVLSETRTYDTQSGLTLPLRMKEDTVDYRFVPDPNLPPLKLPAGYIDVIAKSMTLRQTAKATEQPAPAVTTNDDISRIKDPAEVEALCLDLIKKMKNISKKYAKEGQKRHMYMMLDKLCELTDERIDLDMAIRCLDRLLRKPSSTTD